MTEIGELVGDATVKSPPEIGTVAYACDCSVVDVFSDPGRTLPLIEKRIREAGPVMRFLLEANFARLDRSQRPRRGAVPVGLVERRLPAGPAELAHELTVDGLGDHLPRTDRSARRWRRDLNPRTVLAVSRFQGECIRPLCHATADKRSGFRPGRPLRPTEFP